MAGYAQHTLFVLFCVSAMLSSYLVCQHVSGMALNEAQATDHSTGSKLISVEGNKFRTDVGEIIELFPVSEPHLQLEFNSSRRRLGDFLSCSSCKCCDRQGNNCENIECCYDINCTSYPYGFCNFDPVSCSCNGCS